LISRQSSWAAIANILIRGNNNLANYRQYLYSITAINLTTLRTGESVPQLQTTFGQIKIMEQYWPIENSLQGNKQPNMMANTTHYRQWTEPVIEWRWQRANIACRYWLQQHLERGDSRYWWL